MNVALPPGLSVSRETEKKLLQLCALLEKWNPAVNLVSKSTIGSVWTRHIVDSAQLYPNLPFTEWLDIGSGGGFPGLVIAVLASELHPAGRVTLVEADQRKAAFLREAARSLSLSVVVKAERIERMAPANAGVLSARALAPLVDLCGYASLHLASDGLAVFPKGAGWRAEVDEARKVWAFDLDTQPSLTDPDAVVLKVKAISNV